MITDSLLLLESSRTDVRNANTYVSGNTIDLSTQRDIGAGNGMKALWNIEVAYLGGTSIQFEQIVSASADLSSPKIVSLGAVVPLANLLINALIVFRVPELLGTVAGVTAPVAGVAGIGSKGLRYYGHQEVSLGTMTAGQHSSRLVLDVVDVKHYATGIVIL